VPAADMLGEPGDGWAGGGGDIAFERGRALAGGGRVELRHAGGAGVGC